MAKIRKKDLARGTALNTDHWNSNKSQIEDLMSGEIDTENMTLNNGKFSLTFNWPRLLAEDFCYTDQVPATDARFSVDPQGLNVPIILPPLQDQWLKQIGTIEMPNLVSLSVSFDTYMNNFGVVSENDNTGGVATVNPTFANRYTFEIEIREKMQAYSNYNASTAVKSQNIAPKSIYKTTVGGEVFNSDVVRFNPYFITGIDKLFHPFRTYLLKINFPELYTTRDALERFAPISLTVKLDFETRLVQRDILQGEFPDYSIQNFPLKEANPINATLALDTAVAGANPTARAGIADNGRVQTNIEKVDAIAVEGISSGYDLRSNTPPRKRIIEDASYFCMVVPMFGGWLDVRSSDLNQVGIPWGPSGNFGGGEGRYFTYPIADQRLIPISQPFVIHHVFAVHDYGSHAVTAGAPLNPERPRNGAAQQPISPTFRRRIGVGIASGLRSESKKYEQVAYAEFFNPSKFNFLVDQVVDGLVPPDFGEMIDSGVPSGLPGYLADQEIFQIPLVRDVTDGRGTRSYYDEGNPYFVGKSDLGTKSRTSVGIVGAPGSKRTPLTVGEELFLDVRWVMDDTDPTYGLSYSDPPFANGPFEQTQYIGTSKCWVYIIGKMSTAT